MVCLWVSTVHVQIFTDKPWISVLNHPWIVEPGYLRRVLSISRDGGRTYRVAVISAKNHKRQRHKRQSVTAKREKSQTPKVLTAILT